MLPLDRAVADTRHEGGDEAGVVRDLVVDSGFDCDVRVGAGEDDGDVGLVALDVDFGLEGVFGAVGLRRGRLALVLDRAGVVGFGRGDWFAQARADEAQQDGLEQGGLGVEDARGAADVFVTDEAGRRDEGQAADQVGEVGGEGGADAAAERVAYYVEAAGGGPGEWGGGENDEDLGSEEADVVV